MTAAEFWIPGTPVPAARPRFDSRSRRTYYGDQAAAYGTWKEAARLTLSSQVREFRSVVDTLPADDVRYGLELVIHPDGIAGTVGLIMGRRRPVGLRGDWDNFAKAAADALENAGGLRFGDGRIESARVAFLPHDRGDRS